MRRRGRARRSPPLPLASLGARARSRPCASRPGRPTACSPSAASTAPTRTPSRSRSCGPGDPKDLENLTIREDGAVQEGRPTSPTSARPSSASATVYVVDLSGSMNDDGALTDVPRPGLKDIVDSLPEGDQMAIVSFSDDGGRRDRLHQRRRPAQRRPSTAWPLPATARRALYDGIRKATTLFATRPEPPAQHRAGHRRQPTTRPTADLADAARASVVGSGAAFFAVDLDHAGRADTAALQSIIDRTGGAAFPATKGEVTSRRSPTLAATCAASSWPPTPRSIDAGPVDVTVSVGNLERQASYVVGAHGRRAPPPPRSSRPPKAFGPEWLRGKLGGAARPRARRPGRRARRLRLRPRWPPSTDDGPQRHAPPLLRGRSPATRTTARWPRPPCSNEPSRSPRTSPNGRASW